jgi:hypothetical protein
MRDSLLQENLSAQNKKVDLLLVMSRMFVSYVPLNFHDNIHFMLNNST